MNFGLPETTRFDKRVPKNAFSRNVDISPALKKALSEIVSVHWRNKLADTTMNVAAGKTVTEIDVLEVRLSSQKVDENALRQIDKVIPRHVLFILAFEENVSAWIGYKEAAGSGTGAFKVDRYYHTDWMPRESLRFTIDGLDMDAVWENFVIQVGHIKVGEGKPLGEQIQLDEQKAKLQKEIEKLEKHARNERQPRRKFELAQRIRELKKMLRELERML